MARWSWTCEDEQEGLGLATILERSGLEVHVHDDSAGRVVLTVETDAAQAKALEHKLVRHYTKVENATALARLDRRESWGAIAACCSLGGLLLLLVALRC